MHPVALLMPALVAASACSSRGDAPSGGTSSPDATRTASSAALQPPAAVKAEMDTSTTMTEFHHVNFHVGFGTVLRIRSLRGEMRPRTPGQPINFDDKRTFTIHIASAQVGLTMTDLDHLMNDYVFAYKGAPLRKLTFATKGDQLVQHGDMHKLINIPFEITAALTVTPDGHIRIHPTHIKVLGFLGAGFLKTLGLTLQSMLDLRKAKGVRVEGNDLLLDPATLLPPPGISGHVTAVRIEGNQLIQQFGDNAAHDNRDAHALASLDSIAPNYMRFQGGTLRFGKLFMVHADMEIIDADPSDPFEFSIDQYNQQLVAGYSRNTVSGALMVYMPDLGEGGAGNLKRVSPR